MIKYSFNDINNIFVVGDCHGEFKTYFYEIKKHLIVKHEDEEKPHPKEIEMQERMKRRRSQRIQLRAPQPHRTLIDMLENESPSAIFNGYQMDETICEKYDKKSKKETAPFSNSLFIVAGDCGIGFNKPKYYEDLFNRYNKILEYNNTFLIFVRGNHDDPSYFDGQTINLSNIKAVPDYSVLEAAGKHILCVGGAISVDRQWRKKQEDRINRFSHTFKRKLYWENEAPIFNEDAIKEITENVGKIDYVVSHTAPSFATPEKRGALDEWAENDPTLLNDVSNERMVLDKVFNALRDNGLKPSYWAYGHFDMSFIERRSDTIFRALCDGFNPIEIIQDTVSFLYNEEKNKKKAKSKKKNLNIKKIEPEFIADPFDNDANNGEGLEAIDFDNVRIEPIQVGQNGANEQQNQLYNETLEWFRPNFTINAPTVATTTATAAQYTTLGNYIV